ncbi:MAG: pyrroline-5-carboxylate reductase [Clostridiales bacterium]|jgi:pyrroline-5-carboxylate reductase|nr:pyrroline-5-carboxylate reductase [Clostridiales bacterium]
MKKIGVIGVGNMGAALIKGMLQKKAADAGDVSVFDACGGKAERFAADCGVCAAPDAGQLAERSDLVIVAVKPHDAPPLLAQIKGRLSAGKTVFSVVMGLSIEAMCRLTDGRARYIRCMPNTPALVNEGMICMSFGDGFSDAERRHVASLFSSVGLVEELPEAMLGKITSLTGSSPAYVFAFIEAMADAAVHSGVPRETAYRLAAQSVQGSARMVLQTKKHPGELKDNVCSPGGSTIEAMRVLEKTGFRSSVIEAMLACNEKADEVAKANG